MEENTGMIVADDFIVIKQLPVIEERLRTIKVEIEAKTSGVSALECSKETIKKIKMLMAELNKDFKNFEERRKLVKNKILEPYEAFEAVYKECVTGPFKEKYAELKKYVDKYENSDKLKKRKEIEEYFSEYAASKNIDFVKFSDTHINVTISATKKKLQTQAKAFIDRICDDLALIDIQEYKPEILVEYKASLNVSAAITTVNARHKAIEDEKAKQEQAEQIRREQQAAVDRVKAAGVETSPLSVPKTVGNVVGNVSSAVLKTEEKDHIVRMRIGNVLFEALKSDCIILKQLLKNGKYKITVLDT